MERKESQAWTDSKATKDRRATVDIREKLVFVARKDRPVPGVPLVHAVRWVLAVHPDSKVV